MGDINTNIRIDELESYVKNYVEAAVTELQNVALTTYATIFSTTATAVIPYLAHPFFQAISNRKPVSMSLKEIGTNTVYQVTEFCEATAGSVYYTHLIRPDGSKVKVTFTKIANNQYQVKGEVLD